MTFARFASICFASLALFSAEVGLSSSPTSSEPVNVLINGGFDEAGDREDLPGGWHSEGVVKRIQDKTENWRLRLKGKPSQPNASAAQTVSIVNPVGSLVTVTALVKGSDIVSSDEDQKGIASLTVSFFDENDRPVGKSWGLGEWEGSFSWRPWSELARIPPEAKKLEVRLALEGALGHATFDDVRIFWGSPDDFDPTNLVVDGGFEYQNAFSPWLREEGHRITMPGYQGHSALSIDGVSEKASVSWQSLVLDKVSAIRKAEFELYYQLDAVQASQPGGGARIQIQFWDEEKKLLDTVLFGPWTGNQPWTRFASDLKIPARARLANLEFVMQNARGRARFDEVRITAYSQTGPVIRLIESRNDTSGWMNFQAVPGALHPTLDASFLLDPPAGKHGFLQVKDGHFYFEDGTRVRFFGINLQATQALPTHEEAELYAERLAQWGFNLVRLHHLDAPWSKPNIFDPDHDDTQHLSKDSLDRLDYFISQLKSRGIYIYLDLLVSRKFKKGDKVPAYIKLERGAKKVAQFDRRVIELQKKYATDLLTHRNPYTKTRLVDEPAIVLTEIINESTLCLFQKKKFEEVPEFYLDELEKLWVDYLADNGVADAPSQADRFLDFEDSKVQAFYAALQHNYFQEMHDFLRGIDLKIPIAGSNLGLAGRDLRTNMALDFVDRHAYWDHPQGGYGDLVKFNNALITEEIEPKRLTAEPKRINPILKLSRLRVKNKPFVVGEWNVNWPNEYRAAGPLLMAAYASYQDWDAIIQFNFEGRLLPQITEGNFDVSSKPEIFQQFSAAARLFHEGHVVPSQNRKTYPFPSKTEVPLALGLLHGLELAGEENLEVSFPESLKRPLTSDTRELIWDDGQGLVRIETPRTQAAVGRVGKGPIDLADIRFDVKTPFSVLILTSLDQSPIKDSKHLLLTTTARSENTDLVYNAARTLLRSSGTSPILTEPVRGRVILVKRERTDPRVFALDASGKRIREVDSETKEGALVFSLDEAALFEITWGGPSL